MANFVARAQGRQVDSWGGYNTLAFHDQRGLKVGLVYNHYAWPNICIHVAARSKALWCHPKILYHIFAYPFFQLGCKRVTAPVRSSNDRSLKLVVALGYKYEGTLRRACPTGDDIVLYGMTVDECRWLNYEENDEPFQVLASAAPGRESRQPSI